MRFKHSHAEEKKTNISKTLLRWLDTYFKLSQNHVVITYLIYIIFKLLLYIILLVFIYIYNQFIIRHIIAV